MPSDGDVSDSDPPIADAGEVQTVLKNASVRLDGSASFDPDGRDLSFQWSRVSGPLITLAGSRTAHPTFEAPALGHNVTLEFKLEVGNGLATAEDATSIHVVQTEAETLSRTCDEPNLPLHPLVEFIVEPDDGPGPLTIDCTAITSDGSELPSGPDVTYTWTIDGEADSGPMETHANRSFVLSSSGAHTVTLCLTLSGLGWGCLDAQNAGQRERTVFVWPRISGIVHDGTEGIPGVAVAANNVPGGATDVTNSQGEYELSVPFSWSGVITPHHVDYDFQPANLEQVETTTSVSNQDFEATPTGSTDNGVYGPEDLAELLGSWGPCEGCPYDLNGDGEVDEEDLAILLANWGDAPDTSDPLEHCTSDLDCDDGNFCNGPETCVDLACSAGMNPCPAQMCDEAGEGCVDCLADSDCDDGIFCNGTETCMNGSCVAGSNACPDQLCDEDTDSCFDQSCASDADCDDAAFCNGIETCVNSLCVSGAVPCSGQQCDEDTDACVDCLIDPDCDDGVFCTGAETCQANSCVPGADPCPGQMCDGLGDVCVDCLRNSDCDDGVYCNGAERCQSGSCVNGTAPCAGQSCDEDSDSCGCSTDADCDDGLFCSGVESCSAGICVTSGNPCASGETCDEAADTCISGPAISGTINFVDTVGARPPIGQIGLTLTGSSGWSNYLVTTDINGNYATAVPEGWTGTIESEDPSRVYLTPESLTMPPVPQSGLAGQDFTAWTAPIGVPAPEFALKESHLMYAGATFDFGNGPEPYRDAGNGPYIHYVDNTHPNATDTSNPFGSPDQPRTTIPRNLPAGSVVEINGGASFNGPSRTVISGEGTESQPIFIRGGDFGNKPVVNRIEVGFMDSSGRYMILENLDSDRIATRSNTTTNYYPDHIAIRNCEVHDGGGTAVAFNSSHTVIYNNIIRDGGDWQADYQNDVLGVIVQALAEQAWIVDNDIYHMGGDSVLVGGAGMPYENAPRFVYIGRNVMYENGENAVDIKRARDVIVSQNVMYGFSNFSNGIFHGANVIHDRPENVWFLYNHIYDSFNAMGGAGTERGIYAAIGNVVHDVISGLALVAAFQGYDRTVLAINNTVSNAGTGIKLLGPELIGVGNIITNIDTTNPDSFHIHYGAADVKIMTHNLLYQGGDPIIIEWGGSTNRDLDWLLNNTDQGEGCVVADPLFVDPATLDFHLQTIAGEYPTDSPALDAGINHEAYDTFLTLYGIDIRVDFDGAMRPLGSGFDIGAFERHSQP